MIVVSYAPVVEEVFVNKLNSYLVDKIRWADQYPNYPQVKVSNEYPWVPYMQNGNWPDLNKISETLFPSVTIISSQDVKSPALFVQLNQTALEKTEYDDFKILMKTEGYILAPEALAEIETHFLTKDILYGSEFVYQNRDTISFDITTDDPSNIKNRLYDLCQLFLKCHEAKALYNELKIQVIEYSVSGSRSGTYNIDFGRVLRGASIHVEVDYTILQTYYDTDADVITDILIDHTVG